ncbi:MAG TPA: HAMP domain-containing sensor histidine kinase [Actinomycetota bacterium]
MTSLRGRLFAATLAAVLASVILSLGVGALLVRRSVERSILENLGREADLIALREQNARLEGRQLRALRIFLRGQRDTLAIVRRPVPATRLFPDEVRRAVDAGLPAQGKTSIDGQPVLFATRPAGDTAVLVFRPAALGASDWRPFLGSFLIAGLVGVALAAGASFFLARAIARPVSRAAEASRALAAGENPEQLPIEGSEELATLSASFNAMAAQLAGARESERSFLLSVSHELKTPLTAIRGYAEALEEGAAPPTEAAEVITREAARLERLVQDLLDLARMNQRTFTVRHEHLDLAEVARETVRRFEPTARSFGVSLTAEAPEPVPALGDPDRILQVVSNLTENALRCTPAGGTVSVVAGNGGLSVRDTGPGLVPDDVPRAFERFYLHRRYAGERAVGTGLGLALVKELTEAMSGSVSVQSEPGEGTTITVCLPRDELRQVPAPD